MHFNHAVITRISSSYPVFSSSLVSLVFSLAVKYRPRIRPRFSVQRTETLPKSPISLSIEKERQNFANHLFENFSRSCISSLYLYIRKIIIKRGRSSRERNESRKGKKKNNEIDEDEKILVVVATFNFAPPSPLATRYHEFSTNSRTTREIKKSKIYRADNYLTTEWPRV